MELSIRRLKDSDWETLTSWWNSWPDWVNPPKSFLPDDGKGGFIVEKKETPIVAGFLYMTNSKAVLLEWIISNPEYKDNDRKEALELLINGAENVCKELGKLHVFTIGRNPSLIKTHEELGWTVDKNPSYEIIKNI